MSVLSPQKRDEDRRDVRENQKKIFGDTLSSGRENVFPTAGFGAASSSLLKKFTDELFQ